MRKNNLISQKTNKAVCPNYDYVCRGCDYQFEHFQSMKSRKLKKCPECGKLQLERLIGNGAGVIFKGQDWPGQEIKRKNEDNKK